MTQEGVSDVAGFRSDHPGIVFWLFGTHRHPEARTCRACKATISQGEAALDRKGGRWFFCPCGSTMLIEGKEMTCCDNTREVLRKRISELETALDCFEGLYTRALECRDLEESTKLLADVKETRERLADIRKRYERFESESGGAA